MARLKRIAIAVIAAATVAVGSFVMVAPASAMPKTCEEKFYDHVYYAHLGWQYYALGDRTNAYYYWFLSERAIRGCPFQ